MWPSWAPCAASNYCPYDAVPRLLALLCPVRIDPGLAKKACVALVLTSITSFSLAGQSLLSS